MEKDGEYMENKVIEKTVLIIIIGCIIYGILRYKAKMLNAIGWCYSVCKDSIDTTLFYTIVISLCALIGILICWLIAHRLDKKSGKRVEKVFAKVHPRLNIIIAVFILVIMVVCSWAVVYYVFAYMARILSDLIDWMASVTSKLDAVVIVALITGAVSIVGVIISSIVAKVIDFRKSRQDYLAKKREVPYGQFVDMVYKIQQNSKNGNKYTEKMMIEDISKFSKEITLWGSSNVVNKWVKFRENGTNPEAEMENVFLMEEIMNEMRRDLGMKKVKKGNLLAFFVNDIKQVMKEKKII